MDRHADKSARDDRVPPSLRWSEATEAIHKKVDSREAYFASKFMDRHAVQAPLAMTENATNLTTPQDSRFASEAPNLNTHKGGRICDEKALLYERGRRDLPKR